jgi:hypothetical protein
VGQTLFNCNQSGHENELPLGVVGAALMYAVSSILFLVETEGDPKGASENMDLKSPDCALRGIVYVTVWGYQLVCHVIFCEITFEC